jgi:hypothetical protein
MRSSVSICVLERKTMSLNKAIAALLVVVFVLFTGVAILVWSVEGNILDADAYVQVLDEAGFYEVPYELIREGEIPTAGGLLLEEGPLSVVSGTDLEAIARELAPPDWLSAQIERAVRDLVAVAEEPERNQMPGLVISLRQVKERALGEPGDRALSIAVEALPLCAPDRPPLELNSDTPVCKPPDVDLNPFLSRLKTLLGPLVERVPDTFVVSWQPEQQDTLEDLRQTGQTLDRIRFALLLLVALNLALLALVWVLVVRSPAGWLRWTGVPLLLLGLLALLLAALTPRLIVAALEARSLWAEGSVPAPLAQSLESAIRDFIPGLFRPALLAGLVLAGVGLFLSLVSPLFPGRSRSK